MKKKKKGYSLTAKERKNKNRPPVAAEPTPEELQLVAEEKAAKKATSMAFIRIVAVVLAAVIAVTGIIAGSVLWIRSTAIDHTLENPMATITLTDGSTIKMELLYKESVTYNDDGTVNRDGRTAILNFIYLAESGMYDDTIFTNSNPMHGFVAMEGYEAPAQHKARKENFVDTLKGFASDRSNKWGTQGFKLGYRITRQQIYENNNTMPSDKTGYVAMLSGTSTMGSSTGYIMMYKDPQLSGSTVTNFSTNLTYIAKMDSASIDVLTRISNMASADNEKVAGWKIPTDYDSVRIKNVRISNLDRKLKKNIMNDFQEFVLNRIIVSGSKTTGRTSSWLQAANQH